MSIAYPCYYIESYDEAMPFWLDYLQFTVDFEYREKESALYDDLKSGKPGMTEVVIDQAWGKSELHIQDPFGSKLIIASPTHH